MHSPPSAFFFDLASPHAYLAAEQALQAFAGAPEPVVWTPVLASGLAGGEPLAAPRCEQEREALIEDLARRAVELGLQPLRMPARFPFDSTLAMRVATYAKSIGRAVPFAQAAFRQAYAGGRALDSEDAVVIAAAACEMHPSAVLKGAALRSTAEALEQATAEASAAGVREVPAVLAAGRLFHGERELGEAARSLAGDAGSDPRAAAGGSSRADRGVV
ncbi:MAG TPA: DsbA family protein [Solirubrobacteraceae bacterium]|nr:DsbA family protein [Solirubrobacteraceae bacterium]